MNTSEVITMPNEILLELKNISYSVDKKQILKGIDLEIKKSEIHSIIGVNGTGKTTLGGLIMGLEGYRPKKGKIIFDGKDITNLSTTERAKLGITLAWQSPANFEGITVREYLTLKRGFISPEKCLKFVGLNPDLYLDREVNEKLSGGERKRIELASVFSIKPKLVILDEPDSGIDITSIDAIKKVIRNFKKINASVILITHNDKMARISEKASLLCSGKIIKEGNPGEVTKFFKKHCKGCKHVGEIKKEVLDEL